MKNIRFLFLSIFLCLTYSCGSKKVYAPKVFKSSTSLSDGWDAKHNIKVFIKTLNEKVLSQEIGKIDAYKTEEKYHSHNKTRYLTYFIPTVDEFKNADTVKGKIKYFQPTCDVKYKGTLAYGFMIKGVQRKVL